MTKQINLSYCNHKMIIIIILFDLLMPKKIIHDPDYSSDEDVDEDDSRLKQKKKESPPRFIKNSLQDVNLSQIVVNLSKTHYQIIQTVVEELGWVVQHSKKSQKWDIMWTDFHIEAQDLFKLNDHQKISHFPAIYVLAKKNFLGKSLMKMSKYLPDEFNYFPQTWSVPSQIGELRRYHSQFEQQNKQIYIFKPEALSQGKGIALISKLQDLEDRTGIVQIYINNPYLIENLKFDMRIYVLIYGHDPVRIYLHEEGLARFATENYQRAKKKNMKDNFIHLTNYAINKTNKKFIFNTTEQNMNFGHKRSLTSIFNILKSRGVNIGQIQSKIDRLIVKTLLVGKPMLEHMYGLSQTDNLTNDHCFHILGFDVMLDDDLNPILLQVNHTPSFATQTPLDKTIKKNLIKETLLLLNVTTDTKRAKIEKIKEFQEKRSQRKLIKLTAQQKAQQKKIIQAQKNNFQTSILKRYRRLYPVDSNQYSQIQQYAQKIFNEQYGCKNKEKEGLISSKHSSYSRPVSLENLPSSKKLIESKKFPVNRVTSSCGASGQTVEIDLLKKLPEISPKKGVDFLKSSDITMPRKMIKYCHFSPDKIFLDIESQITQNKQKFQQISRQTGNTYNDHDKYSQTKRGGIFIEQKLMKLAEIVPKNVQFFDQLAIECSIRQKNNKLKNRNFMDFIAQTNREKKIVSNVKSPIVLKKDERDYKGKSNLKQKLQSPINYFVASRTIYDQMFQEEIFLMKNFIDRKDKHNFM